MLPLKPCNIPAILVLSVIFVSCHAQRVITDPGTCIRDADCAWPSHFCDDINQCRPRLKENADCYSSHHCRDGLYCGQKDGRDACVPQNKPFEDCDMFDHLSCASQGNVTYKCSQDSGTCLNIGFPGQGCSTANPAHDCQPGNYCQFAGHLYSSGAKCLPQRPLGAACGLIGDAFECKDYCAYSLLLPDISAGVCTLPSRIGQPCREDSQCRGYAKAYNDPKAIGGPKVICNKAKGDIGVCQHERNLIKKDGARCNPKKDYCDSERGLSCRPTPTGPRCMFNRFDGDAIGVAYCDLNSKFSKCNSRDGWPTECRANVDPSSYGLEKEFFQCLRKREILPQGSMCNMFDYTVCEKGTSCEAVPGIEQERFLAGTKIEASPLAPEAKFCVAVKQEGEKCFNKFKFGCAEGLKCENNVCVKGSPDLAVTHAHFNRYCDSLPCVPGTVCKLLGPGIELCEFEKEWKREGESCYPTALKSVVSFLSDLFAPWNHWATWLLLHVGLEMKRITRYDVHFYTDLLSRFYVPYPFPSNAVTQTS